MVYPAKAKALANIGVERFENVEIGTQGIAGKVIFVRKVAGLSVLKEANREGGKPEPSVIEKQVKMVETEYISVKKLIGFGFIYHYFYISI